MRRRRKKHSVSSFAWNNNPIAKAVVQGQLPMDENTPSSSSSSSSKSSSRRHSRPIPTPQPTPQDASTTSTCQDTLCCSQGLPLFSGMSTSGTPQQRSVVTRRPSQQQQQEKRNDTNETNNDSYSDSQHHVRVARRNYDSDLFYGNSCPAFSIGQQQ
jgi:hypothetical protein